jgi:sarcosine oxidase subunit gamma
VASLSAFADCKAVVPAHEAARATPVEPLAAVSLTAWDREAAAAALRDTLGLMLPDAGRWTVAQDIVAVWLGPNHWALQREGTTPLLPEIVRIVGDHAGLIDLTDARAVLRLTGPAAREILSALLPIDLHPRGFAPGRAATTVTSHLTVQLRQIDAAPTYELSVGRSFAGSLWRALELAGAGRLRLG